MFDIITRDFQTKTFLIRQERTDCLKLKKMKKIKIITIFLIIIFIFGIALYFGTTRNREEELLHITTLAYQNGETYDDGVSMVTYVYDVKKKKITQFPAISCEAVYPISYYDHRNKNIYYSNANAGDGFDNLYLYDTNKQTSIQLTDGKFLFNDLIMYGDNLICNVAPQYSTVTKPAIYNIKENSFQYFHEEDDDTWCHSLSYHKTNNKLLLLTCSDEEMRSAKVCEETFIRPKTIYFISPDFSDCEKIYFTDEFEIRSTRQLDAERIMIAADPRMGWEYTDRKIKILNINTQELIDLEIPDLQSLQSFYPRDNAEGVFLFGQNIEGNISIFYYEFYTEEIIDIFEDYNFPEEFCGIIDFIYSYN